jgi:multidrug efflux system membrane fusion protein
MIAETKVAAARATLAKAQRQVKVCDADLAVARAELERARYDLDMTQMVSSVDAIVAPFTARPGDFMDAGKVVLAVVSGGNWHVVANLAEEQVAALAPGQPVHLRLAADPWTLHEGAVRTVTRAVARKAEPQGVVPFVPYATDRIRLERRFPVEINLGTLPRQRRLFAGADVSVLIFLPSGGRL